MTCVYYNVWKIIQKAVKIVRAETHIDHLPTGITNMMCTSRHLTQQADTDSVYCISSNFLSFKILSS